MQVQGWLVQDGCIRGRSDLHRRRGLLPVIGRGLFSDQVRSLFPGAEVDAEHVLHDGLLVEFVGDEQRCAALVSDSKGAESPFEKRRERLIQLLFSAGTHVLRGAGRYEYQIDLNYADLGEDFTRLTSKLPAGEIHDGGWRVKVGGCEVERQSTYVHFCATAEIDYRRTRQLALHAEVRSRSSQGVLGGMKSLLSMILPAIVDPLSTPWSSRELLAFFRLYNGRFNWSDKYRYTRHADGFSIAVEPDRPWWLPAPRLDEEPRAPLSEGEFSLCYGDGLYPHFDGGGIPSDASFSVHRCPSGTLFFKQL